MIGFGSSASDVVVDSIIELALPTDETDGWRRVPGNDDLICDGEVFAAVSTSRRSVKGQIGP